MSSLKTEIEAVIPKILDGSMQDHADSATGGLGLCVEATNSLIQHLGRGEVVWLDLGGSTISTGDVLSEWRPTKLPDEYPKLERTNRYREHCVALVDGWIVDLTVRQYNPDAPFPFIWELKNRPSTFRWGTITNSEEIEK